MTRARRAGLLAPLALTALAALLVLPGLGARDLWNPNEPLYGVAVQEMHERGDWLIPTVEGVPFAEKPILWFWLARLAALALGGVNEWALRLPVALAVMAAVPMVWALVRRHAGPERALLAGALFATTFMTWWGARQLQMDSLVMVSTLAAVLAATRALDDEGSARRCWALAGLAVGLGVLAKGPIAVVLPVAIVTIDAALARRRIAVTGGLLAAAVAVAVAGPWFVALQAAGHGDAVRELIVRQNFMRAIDPWDHAQPWWYYLKYVWIDMAPWSWFVPLAAALPGRGDGERRLERLAWVWIGVVLLVFSLSASKRSAYILPLAPAVAVLAAATFDRLLRGALPVGRRIAANALLTVCAGGMLLAAAATAGIVTRRYPDLATEALLLAGWCGALGVATLIAPATRRRSAAPAALFVFVVGLETLAGAFVLPAVDPYKSARGFAREIVATVPPGAPIAAYRFWRWRVEYRYYGAPGFERLESLDELRAYWDAADAAGRWLIVEDGRLPEARRVLGDAAPVTRATIGGREVGLYSRQPATHGGPDRP